MSIGDAPDLDQLRVADNALWEQGPPHEVFRELRSRRPVHWSSGISQTPYAFRLVGARRVGQGFLPPVFVIWGVLPPGPSGHLVSLIGTCPERAHS